MKTPLDFKTFAKKLAKHNLLQHSCATAAHHSNGSGKDWEALQKELRIQTETTPVTPAPGKR